MNQSDFEEKIVNRTDIKEEELDELFSDTERVIEEKANQDRLCRIETDEQVKTAARMGILKMLSRTTKGESFYKVWYNFNKQLTSTDVALLGTMIDDSR